MQDAAGAVCDIDGQETNSSRALRADITAGLSDVRTAQSIQSSGQAISLMLLCVAFVIIVALSLAIMRQVSIAFRSRLIQSERRGRLSVAENATRIIHDVIRAASDQQQRMTAACFLVLLTFPARAAFEVRLILGSPGLDSSFHPIF